jgi:hypothetical protein
MDDRILASPCLRSLYQHSFFPTMPATIVRA